LVQITRITPCRRITLHRSQRRVTDAATFIASRPLVVTPRGVRLLPQPNAAHAATAHVTRHAPKWLL